MTDLSFFLKIHPLRVCVKIPLLRDLYAETPNVTTHVPRADHRTQRKIFSMSDNEARNQR